MVESSSQNKKTRIQQRKTGKRGIFCAYAGSSPISDRVSGRVEKIVELKRENRWGLPCTLFPPQGQSSQWQHLIRSLLLGRRWENRKDTVH
jgi:hypothetical protein